METSSFSTLAPEFASVQAVIGWGWLIVFCLEALQGAELYEGSAANKSELRFIREAEEVLTESGFDILHRNLILRETTAPGEPGRPIAEFDLIARRSSTNALVIIELKNQVNLSHSDGKKGTPKKKQSSTRKQLNRLAQFLRDSPFKGEPVTEVIVISTLPPGPAIKEWKAKGLQFLSLDDFK